MTRWCSEKIKIFEKTFEKIRYFFAQAHNTSIRQEKSGPVREVWYTAARASRFPLKSQRRCQQ
jgi:hypothetical protein